MAGTKRTREVSSDEDEEKLSEKKRIKKEAKEAKKLAKKEAKKKAKEEAKAAKKQAKKEAKAAKKESEKEAKKAAKKAKKEARKEKKQATKDTAKKTDNDNESLDYGAKSSTAAVASFSALSAATASVRSDDDDANATSSVFSSYIVSGGMENNGWDNVFREKRLEIVVSLLPASLGNVQTSVEESTKMFLLKYSDSIGGIALAFDNIDIKKKNGGLILNELPYIHYTVTCDVLTFCPKIGSKLSGKVTECFPSHLGLLVLGFFNASIPAEYLDSSGYSYDYDKQIWYKGEEEEEEGDNDDDTQNKIISQNDTVHFVVDRIHECAGIVSMDGSKPSSTADWEDQN